MRSTYKTLTTASDKIRQLDQLLVKILNGYADAGTHNELSREKNSYFQYSLSGELVSLSVYKVRGSRHIAPLLQTKENIRKMALRQKAEDHLVILKERGLSENFACKVKR